MAGISGFGNENIQNNRLKQLQNNKNSQKTNNTENVEEKSTKSTVKYDAESRTFAARSNAPQRVAAGSGSDSQFPVFLERIIDEGPSGSSGLSSQKITPEMRAKVETYNSNVRRYDADLDLLETYEKNLKDAQKKYKQVQAFNGGGTVTPKLLNEAQEAYKKAQKQYDELKAHLDRVAQELTQLEQEISLYTIKQSSLRV